MPISFAQRIVRWQGQCGRQDLPWQQRVTPYRVWVSEIMLQQTQVKTVLNYFDEFMLRFPSLDDLARAHEDEVLATWSGLGYYSRARHLHRCAQEVMTRWGGVFPKQAKDLATLPGIGPSTAAAIASLCHGERISIMDGNVQRVLTRWLAYSGDLTQAAQQKILQAHAHDLLPKHRVEMPTYTQGLMDLGATVCKPRNPECDRCPVAADCQARQQHIQEAFPVKTRQTKRRTQSWWLLVLHSQDQKIALVQRPTTGVWARLWSLPMFESEAQALCAIPQSWHGQLIWTGPQKHVLTHRDWWLHFGLFRPDAPIQGLGFEWMSLDWALAQGLPQPVRAVLEKRSLGGC